MVKQTDAKIVLHSGWRMWFDKEIKPLRPESEKLVEMLKKEELSIEGVTPDPAIGLSSEDIGKAEKILDGNALK